MEITLDLMTITKSMLLIMEIVGFAWVIWIVCMITANMFEFGEVDFLEIFYEFLDDCSIIATQLFCISSIIVFGLSVGILVYQYI